MLEGLRTAAAGMAAQQQKLDAVANDLANANTTGYKHMRVGFTDLLYEQGGRPSANDVAARHRRARRRRRPQLRAGRAQAHRRPARRRPSRARASSRSSSPTAARRSRATATCTSTATAASTTSTGGLDPARDHDPRRRHRTTRSRSSATAPSAPTARSSASIQLVTVRAPHGLLVGRRQRVRRHRRVGPDAHRARRHAAHAGRARGLQHRHGAGDGRHDRRAAHLPDDVEGDPDGRLR